MRMLTVCVLLLPSLSMAAPTFFLDCAVALERPEFAPLGDHLRSAPIQQVDQCMRLANSEFLVTANHAGPFNGSASNLFYCNLKEPAATACVENGGGHYYPELTLVRQFSGPRDKQYVLWSTRSLRHGIESSGYHVFQLVPKSTAPRGYIFYSLDVGTQLTYESCEDSSADPSGIEISGVAVRNERTESVTLDFEQKTWCQKNSNTNETVSFVLRDARFQREQDVGRDAP